MAKPPTTRAIGRPPSRKPARPAGSKPTAATRRRPAASAHWVARTREVGWVVLPLRAFLGLVFAYGAVSKIADRRFLDASSPRSMHASVVAAKATSPIGSLLGPVADHSVGFGVLMAAAELAVAIGVLAGLLTRVAAAGGMVLALSLWLTVSWNAQPWFTSADLVYLFAFTPLLVAGAGGVLSLDGWLDRVRAGHPGASEDRTRRALLAGGAVIGGAVLLSAASLFRRSKPNAAARAIDTAPSAVTLAPAAKVPVGGGLQVTDSTTDHPAWVLQLQKGRFTAFDAVCPHQGCTVDFVSAKDGFACPCHSSFFDAQGNRLSGPAPQGLTPIPVKLEGGDVRTT